jgi:uncharacterized protein (DUF2062 family)
MWLKIWRKKQEGIRKSLKDTHLYRIWGHHLFHNLLWRTDSRAIAGGLALGLFVAFTPTLGIQMFLAACGAIYFKVNLPIALAACWITNPLTALPVYSAAWKLGEYLLKNSVLLEEAFNVYGIKGKAEMIFRQGLYLWSGSLIFSTVLALIGYVAIRLLWTSAHKIRIKKAKSTSEEPPSEIN